MAKCRKQFDYLDPALAVTKLTDKTHLFIPELSLGIKDILMQFGYMDNIRLRDMMKHGYTMADDDSDFDFPEIDTMDIAEKHEAFKQSQMTVRQYQELKKTIQQKSEGKSE